MFFHSSIDALRNSRLDAAQLRMEARIGSRSIPIVGGLWSNIKLGFNYCTRFVTVPAALVFGAEPNDASPPPALPKEFEGTELGENLCKAYQQEVEIAGYKAEAAKSLFSLDIVGYKRNNALATHAKVRAEKVTLPEEEARSPSAAIGSALGQLSPGAMLRNAKESLASGL